MEKSKQLSLLEAKNLAIKKNKGTDVFVVLQHPTDETENFIMKKEDYLKGCGKNFKLIN